MTSELKNLINSAVFKMIESASSNGAIKKIVEKHNKKIHFIPQRYRVFGGLLQSMNIQFGNFIETLMTMLVANESNYEIISDYSGRKSNVFTLSVTNDARIEAYITKCQFDSNINIEEDFPKLLKEIVADSDTNLMSFSHNIDLMFRDKNTGIIYYIESKYDGGGNTGKTVDINRKFIATYAYLCRQFNIKDYKEIVPILFFFTNKKTEGNIYIPEKTNIRRGKGFFEQFLHVNYSEVDEYLLTLSESSEVIKMFDDLYKKVVKSEQN